MALPSEGDLLAADGKILQGLHGPELPGVPLGAAYAVATGLVVGPKGVRSRPKASGLAAKRELLVSLGMAGQVVPGDAS